MSGLLVTQSLYSSSSWKNFLWKRFLRLYPAAWFVILACMFILGPLLTALPLKTYFTNYLFFNYAVGLSLVRINYILPGVFIKSVLDPSVNASLWSISLELKLYIGLLIFYFFKIPFKKFILISLIILCVIIEHFYYNETETIIRIFAKNFLLYPYVAYAPHFLTGILCFLYKEKFFSNFFIALVILLIGCLSVPVHWFFAVRFIMIPVLILFIACLNFTFIKRITPSCDLSYGLYIFAFPVQQIISQLIGTTNIHAWQMCLICIICTSPFAFFSWYQIEKKALSFKNKIK